MFAREIFSYLDISDHLILQSHCVNNASSQQLLALMALINKWCTMKPGLASVHVLILTKVYTLTLATSSSDVSHESRLTF